MLFCGIEKTSLNDFPGKISCTIFTMGCNFFCPYCHNPQSVVNDHSNDLSSEAILRFIEQRKNFCDGIVISGGEPTINKDLPNICHSIKKMGYQIKLDTNGSRPDMLTSLLNENLLDYIAMDIKAYPSKKSYSHFTKEPHAVKKIKKSIKIIMNNSADYEFRTTCVNPFITHKEIKQICTIIKGAERYTLQPFNKMASSILNKDVFNNQNPAVPQKIILDFLNIAKPMVKHCGTNTLS